MAKNTDEIVWKDRKRIVFGLPWSFTRYYLTNEKFVLETGLFSRNEDEVRLYRITDISLKRSFGEILFGLGTIHCCSSDKSMGDFNILHIKDSRNIKNMLSEMVEDEKRKNRIGMHEVFDGECDELSI